MLRETLRIVRPGRHLLKRYRVIARFRLTTEDMNAVFKRAVTQDFLAGVTTAFKESRLKRTEWSGVELFNSSLNESCPVMGWCVVIK